MRSDRPDNVLRIDAGEAYLDTLDAAITRGLADADAGRVKPIEAVAARLDAKYRALAEAREAGSTNLIVQPHGRG